MRLSSFMPSASYIRVRDHPPVEDAEEHVFCDRYVLLLREGIDEFGSLVRVGLRQLIDELPGWLALPPGGTDKVPAVMHRKEGIGPRTLNSGVIDFEVDVVPIIVPMHVAMTRRVLRLFCRWFCRLLFCH